MGGVKKTGEGYCLTEKCLKTVMTFGEVAEHWIGRLQKLLESDLKTFKTVLETWRPPMPEESHFYSHETDGRFTTLEMLRRATFNEWFVDQGLLRSLLRSDILKVGDSVADLGAGTGEYAKWLNDTGLVDAFSFDGSADIELLTKRAVKHVNLVTHLKSGVNGVKEHNWVLLLEICEHIPAEFHAIFFQNVNLFAKDGIILSWAPPQVPLIGHTNPLVESEVHRVLEEYLPEFFVDGESTGLVRQHSQVGWLKQTLTVLRRKQLFSLERKAEIDAELETDCGGGISQTGAEMNVMFAGEDLAGGMAEEGEFNVGRCCAACKEHPDCGYWVWGDENKCWLKRTKEYTTMASGYISGGKEII